MDNKRREMCVDCGAMFLRKKEKFKSRIRCYECIDKKSVKDWHKKMKLLGCNVCDPEKLGDEPHIVQKTKKDCPKIMLNGTLYTDVTTLISSEGREKKTYPAPAEWEKIRKTHKKKTDYIIRKQKKMQLLKN